MALQIDWYIIRYRCICRDSDGNISVYVYAGSAAVGMVMIILEAVDDERRWI